jgi:aminopeptidase N
VKTYVTTVLALALAACGATPPPESSQSLDSGGPLLPEQAAYDVRHYDIALTVDPIERTIEGEVTVRARVVADLDFLVLDLDPRYRVTEVRDADGGDLDFEWRGARLWIQMGRTARTGDEVVATVAYGGSPREAPLPPWDGGFTWETTPAGEPWVGVSCQMHGADIWWPCKDHPSDEPDNGVDLRFTVPKPLVCVSNGRLIEVSDAVDDRRTFHWQVSTPINNYGVTMNIAPYEKVERAYTSVTGEEMPIMWWALPSGVDRAERLLNEYVDFVRFLEEELGPYPFRADKCGVVDTPYVAMEHQTVIAYGGLAEVTRADFTWILYHELVHEWWGNLVSASDWRDFWLHEGFDGYMEARYVEARQGIEAYHRYIDEFFMPGTLNRAPVAPAEPSSMGQVFALLDTDPPSRDTDAYMKGAAVLHTLRYVIGDEPFAATLRRWAYPDPTTEAITDGHQCRFASTEEFQALVEELSGRDLDWFFNVYLRQPELPRLVGEVENGELQLAWNVPEGLDFPMPVEVAMGSGRARVEMPAGRASLPWEGDTETVLDPDGWILRAEE